MQARWDHETCVKFAVLYVKVHLLSLIAEKLDCEEIGEKQSMYEHAIL